MSDTCSFELDKARCLQPMSVIGLCRYHYGSAAREAAGLTFRHDPYYHAKVVAGLLKPAWGLFTLAQDRAMFDVRAHRDGRPSDQYRRGVTEDLETRSWV